MGETTQQHPSLDGSLDGPCGNSRPCGNSLGNPSESAFGSGHYNVGPVHHPVATDRLGSNAEERKHAFDSLIVQILASNGNDCVAWPYENCRETAGAFLRFASHHRISPLIHHRLSTSGALVDWPEAIQRDLASAVRTEAAYQMLRDRDVVRLAAACRKMGITPIFFKGYALANTVYPMPSLRPSVDVDLVVRPSDIEAVVRTLEGIGFERFSPYRGQRHSNEIVCRRNTQVATIEFDCHFQVNNRSLLAQLLSYDELRKSAIGPSDHDDVLVPCLKHSLLLACIHRTAHDNTEDLLWLNDFSYLSDEMTPDERRDFVATCQRKQATQICRSSLSIAAKTLDKPVLLEIADQLVTKTDEVEPTAIYLRASRSAVGDALIRWQSLTSTRDKIGYILELLLPSQNFLNWKYGPDGRWRRLRNSFDLVRMGCRLVIAKPDKSTGDRLRQGPTRYANEPPELPIPTADNAPDQLPPELQSARR